MTHRFHPIDKPLPSQPQQSSRHVSSLRAAAIPATCRVLPSHVRSKRLPITRRSGTLRATNLVPPTHVCPGDMPPSGHDHPMPCDWSDRDTPIPVSRQAKPCSGWPSQVTIHTRPFPSQRRPPSCSSNATPHTRQTTPLRRARQSVTHRITPVDKSSRHHPKLAPPSDNPVQSVITRATCPSPSPRTALRRPL